MPFLLFLTPFFFLFILRNTVSRTTFAPRTEAKMMVESTDFAISNIAQNANLVATSVSDNGGYFWPIFGILSIAGLILYLSPPLADVE
jgi:hypothetical protein